MSEEEEIQKKYNAARETLKAVEVEILIQYSGKERDEKLRLVDEEYTKIGQKDYLLSHVNFKDHCKRHFKLEKLRSISTLRTEINKIGYNAFDDSINSFADLVKVIGSHAKPDVMNAIADTLRHLKVSR